MSDPERPGTMQPGDPLAGYTTPPPPGAGGPVAQRPAPRSGHVLASWGSRAGALIIDGLIVGAGALILFIAITAPFSIGFLDSEDTGVVSLILGALLAVVCVSIVALLYAPALMARTNGKTLGRMAMGIRVVRAGGEPITFGFAMLREVVVKTLLFGIAGAITGGIAQVLDYLWPLWDEENRALHDFVVNTRTIVDR
jgi:uncharacterized RDD family membrane protein YckC